MNDDARDLLAGVRRAIDNLLAAHLASLAAELDPLGPACTPLVDTLSGTLSGGKRLRAAFCFWSWRAHAAAGGASPADQDRALRVGGALELFHAAALIHDDVMDASDTRRGRPAAHRAFETRHRAAQWSGDAARFGESAAILLGDLALITSERELTAAVVDLDAGRRAEVRAIFDEMRVEVTAGQYLDVLGEVTPWGEDPRADEAHARAVVRAKSARYSVEHPLTLGAALAGAGPDDLGRLRRVGSALGEAFQLRDDLLGVFGDPATTGKPAGDDLREGKRTLLVVRAAALADEADARLLRDRLGRADLTEAQLDELRELLHASGAVAEIEQRISDLAEPALAELGSAPLAPEPRRVLVELGRAAVHRTM
ncbi:polyprenyl synthetase family protein [Isoptericola sp. b441]|uniref:Polyprenyl synthetase family protein n=1 Tax=Actinotalea lenta TaxID=3064654 RepID=A0ABT9DAN0_9CELL|nr:MULTISPECIES: polyprenyl synthetase family protein [unclassified Isoptericola]MDO8107940.1 polyprenyl synthetase family protein [Isoptericola sp. b441]MDO8120393.1 polyprenyl synthetase family protein [Isoptericola sp. b490]